MTATAPRGAGDGDRQVLQEGVEALCHAAMPVHEVQHFVEQQQHRCVRGGEHPCQCLGPRRRGPCGRAEGGDTAVSGQLASDVDPGRFAPLRRVPGVANEHAEPRLRRPGQAGFT